MLLFHVASLFLPPAVTHELTKGRGKSKVQPLDDAWSLNAVSQLLESWAQGKMGDGPLHVAIVALLMCAPALYLSFLWAQC
jgi:hypothetical protein